MIRQVSLADLVHGLSSLNSGELIKRIPIDMIYVPVFPYISLPLHTQPLYHAIIPVPKTLSGRRRLRIGNQRHASPPLGKKVGG
jgi:hypothetical protein